MEKKQFELFQTAIQWVADEQRRKRQHRKKTGPSHIQSMWGAGYVERWIKGRRNTRPERDYAVVCASSCCLAGDIVLANGDQFVSLATYVQTGDHDTVEHCIDAEGVVHTINARAQELIGVTATQSMALFASEQTADGIIQLAQVIAARNGYEMEIM